MHRDLRGMSYECIRMGDPLGSPEGWGGGWGGAPRQGTQSTTGKGLHSYICKICFSPPSSLSPILPLLGTRFSSSLHFPTI
jgi:hypothetical protein